MTTAATYPQQVVNFGLDKVNNVDLIQAADPNTLRAEVLAIEAAIGVTPSLSTNALSTSTWHNDGRDFGTVIARLANIEIGVVADTHTQYLRNTGGSTLTPATASTVGLTVVAAASQTADLTQWQNSSGTIITRVGSDGNLYVNNSQISGVDYTENFLLGGM